MTRDPWADAYLHERADLPQPTDTQLDTVTGTAACIAAALFLLLLVITVVRLA